MLKAVVTTSLRTISFMEHPVWQQIDSSYCVTHQYCNDQALGILQKNGFIKEAMLLAAYYQQLQNGVIWADLNWKNIHHFLHPTTRRGFWHFSNAACDYQQFFSMAIKHIRQGCIESSIFYLGAAANLVQDMCVPHHAKCQLFDGHKRLSKVFLLHFLGYFSRNLSELILAKETSNFLIIFECSKWYFLQFF